MTSTAAILFIRNDADDIGWWIAYHLAVGFDRLVIYDDQSTDGTWDILQIAAGLFPVEVHRVTAKDETLAARRSTVFSQAITEAKGRFDWVICLDSDEYVYPQDAASIGDYLARFPEADGVTINWSIYGSNNHVTRVAEAPIAAYTQRAPLDFADHALGKTFIRPEAYSGHSIDTVHWALDPDRHLSADGTCFDPSRPANWEGARILHYVTRNLGHYTRRLAVLPSPETAPDLWSHFNRNDQTDDAALRFLPATRDYAARLWRAGLETLYWRLRKDIAAHSLSFLPQPDFSVKAHRSLKSPPGLLHADLIIHDGKTLTYDPAIRSLILAKPDAMSEGHHPVQLLIESDDRHDHSDDMAREGLLLLPGAQAVPTNLGAGLMPWIPVRISGRLSDTSSTMAALTLSLDGKPIGLIGADSIGLTEGEAVILTVFIRTPDQTVLTRMRAYLALRGHGNTLHDFCLGLDMLRHPDPEAMACAMAHLDNQSRVTLETRYPALVPPWLMAS